MRQAGWLALIGCVGLAGCQPPLAPTRVELGAAPATTASAASQAEWPRELGTVAVAVPADLKIDGDTAEWGPRPTSRRVIYVAPAPDRLVLAATFVEPSRPVTLALTSPIPCVPAIGWISRGGYTHPIDDKACQHEQVPGPEGSWDEGRANPPEVVQACTALLARRQAFVAVHDQRFVRHIVLSRTGVTVDGQPVAGALHRSRDDGGVEVQLPLSAMPELAEAPLRTLLVRAAIGPLSDDVPLPIREYEKKPDARWQTLVLATPIEYAPNADARRIAFDGFRGLGEAQEGSISYRPADPEHVEVLSTPETLGSTAWGANTPERQAVVETSAKLFDPIDKLGDIDIGLSVGRMLMTRQRGELVASASLATVDGVVARGGEMHFFSYSPGGFDTWMGTYAPPTWSVLSVHTDGKIDAQVADEGVDNVGDWQAWDQPPTRFSDEKFTKFGMRGMRKGRTKVVTWIWSDKAARYLVTVVPKDATQTAEWQAERKRSSPK